MTKVMNYLTDMYRDPYFPDFLVDNVKATIEVVQLKLDEMTEKIIDLAEVFDEDGSEIEMRIQSSWC